jgi:peptidoglycan/LPS O-acetylase OafA/YrhL
MLLVSNKYNPPVWTLLVELLGALCLPFFAALSRGGKAKVDLIALAFLAPLTLRLDAVYGFPALFVYLPAFYLGCVVRTHGKSLVAAAAAVHINPVPILLLSSMLMVVPEAIAGPEWHHSLMLLEMSVAAFGMVCALAWGRSLLADAIMLNPFARLLGRISYSFYLWHALLLFALVRTELWLIPPEAFARSDQFLKVGTFFASAALTIGVATLSYRFVEQPFIRIGKRLGSRPDGAAAGAGAAAAAGAP